MSLQPSFLLKLSIGFALIAILFLASRDRRIGEALPELSVPLKSTGASYGAVADECAGKERCLLVYLAPWCGACRGSIGFLQALATYFERDGDWGLKVVVGRDDEGAIDEFARGIPLNTYLDYEGRWSRAFGGAVPSWILLDSEQKLLKSDSGLYHASANDMRVAEYFVSNDLS